MTKAEIKLNVGRPTGMQEFSYKFSHSESEKLGKFQRTHQHPKLSPTSGGMFVYSFNPSSIGTSIKVKCLSCNKEGDITDYDNW